MHLDGKGAKYIQLEIILWPPAQHTSGSRYGKQTLRVGLLTSFVQPTPASVKNVLVSIATRHTMMEDGNLHRNGPRSRPAPPTVLEGPTVTATEAQKWDIKQLLLYINTNVTSAKLKGAARHAANALRCEAAQLAADAQVSQDMRSRFPPIVKEKTLRKIWQESDETQVREIATRALLGGLAPSTLRNEGIAADIVCAAGKALRRAEGERSLQAVCWFVDRSGRGRWKRQKLEQ